MYTDIQAPTDENVDHSRVLAIILHSFCYLSLFFLGIIVCLFVCLLSLEHYVTRLCVFSPLTLTPHTHSVSSEWSLRQRIGWFYIISACFWVALHSFLLSCFQSTVFYWCTFKRKASMWTFPGRSPERMSVPLMGNAAMWHSGCGCSSFLSPRFLLSKLVFF